MDLVERIGRTGLERGLAVYLVGGVVRDLLLGRPTKDLDLVVVGDACSLAATLARSEGASLREHRTFGTATIAFDDGFNVDFATARRETYARPAALPKTSPSDLVHDLARRDFSINSMALDLAPSRFGAIIDPFGGRADLRRGLIRVLHDRSFRDDPTRAFRAARFAVRMGFDIEHDTSRLIREAVGSGLFDRLSGTRVRREISLLFDERDWAAVGSALRGYGVWRAIDPGLLARRGDAARLERAESWAEWYEAIDGSESIRRWVLALATLSLAGGRDERERLVARLRPDRRDARDLLDAPAASREILKLLRSARHPRPSRVYRTCEGAGVTSCLVALVDTRPGAVRQGLVAYLCRWRSLEADITGADLLRAGVARGPKVGHGLRAAFEAKLDGRAVDRAGQLEVALRAARSGA
jgi:tRNA nucleotidyltransferase (CCA-adding enzyme)